MVKKEIVLNYFYAAMELQKSAFRDCFSDEDYSKTDLVGVISQSFMHYIDALTLHFGSEIATIKFLLGFVEEIYEEAHPVSETRKVVQKIKQFLTSQLTLQLIKDSSKDSSQDPSKDPSNDSSRISSNESSVVRDELDDVSVSSEVRMIVEEKEAPEDQSMDENEWIDIACEDDWVEISDFSLELSDDWVEEIEEI